MTLPQKGAPISLGSLAGRLIETMEDARDPIERKRLRELLQMCRERGVSDVELNTGRDGGSWNKDDCLAYLRAATYMPQTRALGRTGAPDLMEYPRPSLLRLGQELGIVTNPKTTITDAKLREKIKEKLDLLTKVQAGSFKGEPKQMKEKGDGDDAPAGGEHAADADAGDLDGPERPDRE